MKSIMSLTVLALLIFSPFSNTQTMGISAGYGFLNMAKVNDVLGNSQTMFTNSGYYAFPPDEINGGFYFSGNIKYGIDNFNLGVSGGYLSSTGGFRYSDYIGSFSEDFDVSTIEILGLIEFHIPTDNSFIRPFIQVAGGIGFASVDYTGNLTYNPDSDYNLNVVSNLGESYFAGRIKGGLQFDLQKVVLELGVGYRIANAGEIKGGHVQNGIQYNDLPLLDNDGNAIDFNYSGLILTGGVSFRFGI